jgi:SNF2 family DNA or RNA helicase
MSAGQAVVLKVEGDEVVVTSEALVSDRHARMFFGSILSGKQEADGWRCPRRRVPVSRLVVRINSFLESKGWAVERHGVADVEVLRELERKRSFKRTRDAAVAFRNERESAVELADVKRALAEVGWDEDARRLRPHQATGLLHALVAGNAANFSVPGSGKTATTLAVAAAHLASGTVNVILVVGPLSSFAPWEREAQIALPGRLRVSRVRGSAQKRHSKYDDARAGALLLTSYASAAADKVRIIELCRLHKVLLVVDESHRVKRFRGGYWAPALVEIARFARVRIILSGTPMPQSGKDLYTQLNILWPDQDLTGPPDEFASRVQRNLGDVLRGVLPFISRAAKNELGLPPYELIRHEAPISATQGEVYSLIEDHFRRYVSDAATWQEKLERLKRGRPIRLLQAATNPDLLNGVDSYFSLPRFDLTNPTLMERLATYSRGETPGKSIAALQLVRSIAKEGGKVVCWSNFIGNLDAFSRLVSDELSLPCFQVDGRIPAGDEALADASVMRTNPKDEDTRERIIERFLKSRGPAVLVTNPASCSESISLHSTCHNAIYLDRTYDCALFLQSIDRIHRLGLSNDVRVRVHVLLATYEGRETIDHLVDESLREKEARMRELLEGANLAPVGQSEDPLEDAMGSTDDLSRLLRYLLGEEEA